MRGKTLKFRLKDKHAKWLGGLAQSVNFIWNAGQEYALKVLERERRFVTGFDLDAWASGAQRRISVDDGRVLRAVGQSICSES
jgi:putative transposase